MQLLGQERPIRALRTGLELYAPGYNVFVSGIVGTGRTSLVKDLLEEITPACRLGPDRVYVHNFREPMSPRLLSLPRERAIAFREDVDQLGFTVQDALLAALQSRPQKMSRRLVVKGAQARERRLMAALSREAAKQSCEVVQFESQGGLMAADIFLTVEGEAVSHETLSSLVSEGRITAAERARLLGCRESLLERLEEVSERLRGIREQTEEELRGMDQQVAKRIFGRHFREFKQRWPIPAVIEYLDLVESHALHDVERWVPTEEEQQEPGSEAARTDNQPPPPGPLSEFVVHVVKTHEEDEGCPVVVESNPSYGNLFGTIEQPKDGSPLGLHHIHPGSLLRADGGYLVLRARDVLNEPGVWKQLKRTLKSGELEIREFDPGSGTAGGIMHPQPIPIDLKIVMIGETGVYEQLAGEDEQFLQTFKVHAEFDATVPNNAAGRRRYADFVSWLVDQGKLPGFSPDAMAAVVEHGVRYAGRCDRLTTSFGEIADLAHEAVHLSRLEAGERVERAHVRAAATAREERLSLLREQIERDFAGGQLLLHTSGTVIGQVNGLTVIETPVFSFGRPCRITATTGVGVRGTAGLLNIEREVELSGPIYDKGVMILSGFLLEQFAQDGPLCLQASVCLEQSYSSVDGDSASSAELCALLSSLSKVPLDQGFGLTGSVNQKGQIQTIGGVNEKIEGFFRLCRARRLTGRQGVIIPAANVGDLMLDEEVVAAVRAGTFSVHAISDVRDGLEILTGLPAEEVFSRAAATLARYRRLVRETYGD